MTMNQHVFSLVIAAYNVAAYLPEFIESIHRQTFPLDHVQIIVVDDGSTDDSLPILREWELQRPELVQVLSKKNGGQGSARNMGLGFATGEWLSFPDPDDKLDPHYLSSVSHAIRQWPSADMIACKKILWNGSETRRYESHPHDYMYETDQVVNLDDSPDFYTGSVAAGFCRRDRIMSLDLTFNERIRPNFEDAHFVVEYLADLPEPKVAFLGSAQYYYRKRADGSSTLQTSLMDPQRYTVVPQLAYLNQLETYRSGESYAPAWIQNQVIYDLSWLFRVDNTVSGAPTAAVGDVAAAFVSSLRKIATLLDPEVVGSFRGHTLSEEARAILQHGFDAEPYVFPQAVITMRDGERQLVRLRYWFVGREPDFQCFLNGQPISPVATKVRSIRYFEADLLSERIIWISGSGNISITVGGHDISVRDESAVANQVPIRRWPQKAKDSVLRALARPLDTIMEKGPWGAPFRNAWVLCDWIKDADDNAERLFRYLRQYHSETNAWFVIKRDTPEWRRLQADGYGDRLIAHGSMRWMVLMHNCLFLITSHPNPEVIRPKKLRRLADKWKIIFLQHGVIRDDISRWLNRKKLDLMVTSTPKEHESIVSDGSPYGLTSLETKMIGLARFDRLLELGKEYPPEAQDIVLVAPTWRFDLTTTGEGVVRRSLSSNFAETDFARNWLALLRDPDLFEALRARGKHFGFLPHPNMQRGLEGLDLPDSVEMLRYEGQDVQRHFARACLLVTDYSSVAFNLAYLQRPTVYFQFDRDTYFDGTNTSRPGYFIPERDGFGPVTHDLTNATQAIIDLLNVVPEEYLQRMETAFPLRDGKCCERHVAELKNLERQLELERTTR